MFDGDAVLFHRGFEDGTRHLEGAVQVQVDDLPEGARGNLLGGGGELTAGVVVEPADRPQALGELRDRLGDRVVVADVHRLEVTTPPVRPDLLGGLRENVLAPADDRDLGPEARQLVGGTAAEARAAAGDQDRLALEEARAKDAVVAGHRVVPPSSRRARA